ncbi:MAG: Na/Pi cotransporter family protein [Clostridia bacterium]|nr:Na/Pi cotransporter family protein [Clostridia bacterium]
MTIWEMISMLGGVGLFLYGMTAMSTGLKNAAGDKLRSILERVTTNRVAAVLIGILVTVLIQSSSATDMMVIGFVNSGLMNLSQAIGVIMGANIGTTVTAQITAFNLTAFAPLLLFAGCVMNLFARKSTIKHIGSIVLGFGMLFVGIGLIKTSISSLADEPVFVSFLSTMEHPAVAVLFGIAFTALLQSSSSSVVIFQAFAVEGLLSYHQCAYLVIGAAVGAVTPNLLASLTTDRNGKRTALLNLFFNLFRAALLITLITLFPAILEGIRSLSPNDVARQIANTHTLFALFAVIVMLPFSDLLMRLSRSVLPMLPSEQRTQEQQRLVYLVNAEKNLPVIALRQGMLEINRMGRIARDNLDTALQYFFDPTKNELFVQVEASEQTVDFLNHAISDKLVRLRSLNLSDRDVFRLSKMMQVVSNYERVSDHAENIIEFAAKLKNAGGQISDVALRELRALGDAVLETLDVSMRVFEKEDFSLLPQAEALEQRVDDMQEQYVQNHINRLMTTACDPLGGVIFTDMCTDLERCADQAINVATALTHMPKR